MPRRFLAGPRTIRRAVGCACLTGAVCVPSPLAAQGDGLPDRQDAAAATQPAQCHGDVIRDIAIHASAPTVAGVTRFPVLGDIARATHATTRPHVIRGFLLFAEGDRCTEFARAESERILRAQPFLADARVTAIALDDGVRIEVHTIDEGAMVFGTRVLSGQPLVRSLRLGNGNLAGRGMYVAGEWRAGRALRDGAGITVSDYLAFGKPYVLYAKALRSPLGGEWHTSLTRPFLTGLQAQAWRAGAGETSGYTELVHPDSGLHAVRVERRYADAGAMFRVGSPVRMGLLGLVMSHERESVAPGFARFSPQGFPMDDTSSQPATRYQSTRLNAFVGVRALDFVRVEGFDALSAAQDIPAGVQAGLVIGRGIDEPAGGGAGREIFLAADLYAGRADANDATRVQLRAQGSRAAATGAWGRVIATGSATQQYKPAPRHTLELTGHWALSWRSGVPMQLLLGAKNGGVRGYDHFAGGGARRASVRLEDRWLIGNAGSLGEYGIAAFGEAGRIWRGDAPFGVTTPLRTSVGVSILAAVPARSARLWRVDLAVPLQGASAGRVELGFSNGDRTSVFWKEPPAIATMRGRAVPASVFAWP